MPRVLVSFAKKEWKAGDAARAAQFARKALAVEPDNHIALSLLGNIKAAAGQVGVLGRARGPEWGQRLAGVSGQGWWSWGGRGWWWL